MDNQGGAPHPSRVHTETALEVENLTKWYGPRQALKGLSFSITHGEVVGLLGPNGSGKTTTLRIITGYLRPSSGRVSVYGIDALKEPLSCRAQIGYVPEDIPLYNNMRVGEFLNFVAQVKGVPAPLARRAVDDIVERLGLGPFLRLVIGKLSRGYRQRVAVAQALVSDPKILVLDEPTNGLDPHQIIATRELIRSLAGVKTVLVASHILAEMAKVADRVMILLEGKLLADRIVIRNGNNAKLRVGIIGDDTDQIEGVIRQVTGVRQVEVESSDNGVSSFIVEVDENALEVAGEIAKALVSQGYKLAALSEVSPDLETIFLNLTKSSSEALQ